MREIKFRQWDSVHKRYQFNIGVTGPGSWSGPSYVTWEKYPLEQFTGLHDKNGKEIYEGDIVRWFINDKVITAEVYYEELQAWFTMGKGESGGLVLCDWMRGEYEVIGNINENPELLNAR